MRPAAVDVPLSDAERGDLASIAHEAARLAAGAIMHVYGSGFSATMKSDSSPVTEADTAAEAIILDRLSTLVPDLPVIAEESVAAGRQPSVDGRPFWLVDPLDGTREFIARNGEFTVNIALIEGGRPVLGVVHLPAKGTSYVASGPGRAAAFDADGSSRPIAARRPAADGLVVVASRSHRDQATEDWLSRQPVKRLVAAGSALKFCVLAEGLADVYPRFGRTMEWDTAAGQAVLSAAGGSVEDVDGRPLGYGKPGFKNPSFIARGRSDPLD